MGKTIVEGGDWVGILEQAKALMFDHSVYYYHSSVFITVSCKYGKCAIAGYIVKSGNLIICWHDSGT